MSTFELNDDDVVTTESHNFVGSQTFMVSQSRTKIETHLRDQTWSWVGANGLNCKVLKPGAKSWQKGKLRLRFEIYIEFEPEPDEPDPSPLDAIRDQINQLSQ